MLWPSAESEETKFSEKSKLAGIQYNQVGHELN